MSGLDIRDFLKPGDHVLIGEATAEPPELIRQLLAAAGSVDDLTVFCGYTLAPEWKAVHDDRPTITSYVAHGTLRPLAAAGLVRIVPLHLSEVEKAVVTGKLPIDVVLIQVGPMGNDGCYDLGPTVDYAWAAAQQARVVLVEVNEHMPRTRSTRRLSASRVTAAIDSSRALAGSPARPPSETERQVAAHVARYVRSGSTVQLGASALADAIAEEISDRRDLRVRSGLVGDWLVDLQEAGALSSEPGSCVVGIALGSPRLYDFLARSDVVEFAPTQDLVAPQIMLNCEHFVSMNSTIEVDILGQANSEVAGGRYVGAVGGQVDFFRAARAARSGSAIIAMASTSPSGQSRIVPTLSGPTTTSKSDVDVVVTEWGAAEIGSLSLADRVEALARVAHPDHRDALRAARPAWA